LPSPNQINSHCATIRPLDIYRLDFRKIGPWNRTRQPHGLLNFVAFPTLPDDQIGNHSRVVQNRANCTGPEHGNLLAVYAIAVEAPAIPPNLPFSLFHHLIPIPVLSSKIPVRWCVFKESVKVCTPESPSSADDAPLDFSATDVFAHRARTQAQHFRRIVERQQTVSDRFGSIFSGVPVPRSRFVFAVFHFEFLITLSKRVRASPRPATSRFGSGCLGTIARALEHPWNKTLSLWGDFQQLPGGKAIESL